MIRQFLFFTIASSLLLCLSINKVSAQLTNKVSANASGNILRVKNASYNDVEGSPYLFDNWVKGSVKFFDAKAIENVDLKLDLLENVLVVKGKDDAENLFDSKVSEFSLNNSGKERLFRTGFIDAKNQIMTSYFEVLYDGKIKLLSKEVRSVIESKGYNTSTVTKKIEGTVEYYIARGNTLVNQVKLNEKAILASLEKPELGAYVKENKLNLKNTADIIKLLQHYDTL